MKLTNIDFAISNCVEIKPVLCFYPIFISFPHFSNYLIAVSTFIQYIVWWSFVLMWLIYDAQWLSQAIWINVMGREIGIIAP